MNMRSDNSTPALATLVDLLYWRAQTDPDRLAYCFLIDGETEGPRLTYGELDQRAQAIADMLASTTVSGNRILLALPTGMDYIAAFFGCLYAGMVAVPSYPPRLYGRPDRRLEIIAKDAQAAALLTTADACSKATQHESLSGLRWLAVDDPPAPAAQQPGVVLGRQPTLSPSTLALLQYTSGSTAEPKGVMISHANVLHNLDDLDRGWEHSRDSVMVTWLPLFHDMGLIYGVLQPLYNGFVCYMMQPAAFLQRPFRWLQAMSHYRATHSGGPNFAYDLCVRTIAPEQRAQLDLSHWQMALNAAETVREDTLQRFATAFEPCGFTLRRFCPGYGLAEATLKVTAVPRRAARMLCRIQSEALARNRVLEAPQPGGQALVGCGTSDSDTQIIIVDPETLTTCSPEQVGEIWVAGQSVAQGYWQRPEQTEQTFRARLADSGEGPFLRTGDLGFLRHGELVITGRLKDILIIRGLNYYPQDIELTVAESHLALRADGGAAFTASLHGEERLVVVQEVLRQHLRRLSVDDVVGAIREAVAAEHGLQVYAVLLLRPGGLPRTSSGKVQRHACQQGFMTGTLNAVVTCIPDAADGVDGAVALDRNALLEKTPEQRGPSVEGYLKDVLSALLHLPRQHLDREQPLNRLGLDSLTAMQLQQYCSVELGLDLPLGLFLQGMTIAELAEATLDRLNTTATTVPVAAAAVEFPLSYNQQALWIWQRQAPDGAAYNLIMPLCIRSPLNVEALQDALATLVARHPALRTTYHLGGDGRVTQRIQAQSPLRLQQHDASAWTEPILLHQVCEEAYRPFDLEHGPPLRTVLFTRSEEHHILLLTVHHIAGDLWSLLIMLDELSQLYSTRLHGTEPPLTPLSRNYQEYVHWQAEQLAGSAGAEQWAYWREQLAGELPVLNLATDWPRPPTQRYRGARHRFRLSPHLSHRLKALAQQLEVTLYTILLAAFQVLLYRHTGQEDILVGSPAAGRGQLGSHQVVGCFMNLLVMRGNLSGNPPFREFLARLRDVVMAALTYQAYPFQLLVEQLKPERDTSYSPLFQALFTLQQLPRLEHFSPFILGETGARMELGDFTLEPIVLEQRTAQFDLSLTVVDTPDALMAAFDYNRDLFEASSIERMSAHFLVLLDHIIADPEGRIGTLPLFGPGESQRLLYELNATDADYAKDQCLHHLLADQARRTPDTIALICGEHQLTYHQLDARANRLAQNLHHLGVGPEVLVGVLAERGVELLIYLIAVLKAGGAYLPLDPAFPRQRLALMLEDAELLVTQSHRIPDLPEIRARVVCPDSEPGWDATLPETAPPCATAPHNLAYTIYTSGSTGRPKGVQISHRAALNLLGAMRHQPGLSQGDRLLAVTTASFDIAVLELFLPLLVGAQVVVASREQARDGVRLSEQLDRHDITVMQATPAMWTLLCSADWRGQPNLTMLCGGESLSRDLARRLLNCGGALWNMYGPTETTVWSCVRRVEAATLTEGSQSIGRPIANTRVYILDAHLQPVPTGVAGDLYIGGVGLARGYRHEAALTAAKFIPDPYSPEPGARMYHTGDLARFLSNGEIAFLGRCDQQVKIRGFRIEPGEIEAVLLQHPTVQECVVVARPAPSGEPRLIAYTVGPQAQEALLRDMLRQHLPDYMLPTAFVMLPALPQTPNGKVDRNALPEPTLTASTPDCPPQTPTETALADMWRKLLEQPQVGGRSNFFELGGHSLLAMQLISRVREQFLLEVPLNWIFESPTVSELASRIDSAATALVPLIEPVAHDGALPLSFAQQRLWFLEQLSGPSADYHMAGVLRIEGPLQVDILHRSLSSIVRRHQSLRTRFPSEQGRPVQHISRDFDLELPAWDLRHLPPAQRVEEEKRHQIEQAQRPFDLERDLLLRAELLQMDAQSYHLLLTLHHIVADGWSVRVLLHELIECYRADAAGESPQLTELPIQYADFASWQRKYLTEAALTEQRQYWRRQLETAPRLLDLPIDRPRPSTPGSQGARDYFELDAALCEHLRDLSRRLGATMFMVLEAAFAALLSRYSSQTDIVIGSPVAGRDRRELEPLIGCFINTLALRNDLAGDPSFATLVKRVRHTVLAAYAHQALPFEQVVDLLQPERNLSHNPLFQALFTLETTGVGELESVGLRFTLQDSVHIRVQYDLTLALRDTQNGLSGYLEYRTELFEAATVRRFLGHFRTLLEAAVTTPQLRLSKLPLLSDSERHTLLTTWNPSQSSRVMVPCMHELFEAQVVRTPAAAAIVSNDGTLDYHTLNARANQLAQRLQTVGVEPETVVGVCLERGLPLGVALLGVLKAGGVYLPLAPDFPRSRIAALLADAEARVLLTQSDLAPQLTGLTAHIMCLDAESERLRSTSSGSLHSRITPDHLAYLMYTSGSTGEPKGVAVSHGALAEHCHAMHRYYQLTPDDRVLQFAAVTFDPFLEQLLSPLIVGATVVLRGPELWNSTAFTEALSALRLSVVNLPPAYWQRWIQDGLSTDALPDALRLLIIGGDTMTPQALRAWQARSRPARLLNAYGPTEATITALAFDIPESFSTAKIPIGRPLAGRTAYILDRYGNPVPIGVRGELYLGGASLARGYRNRPGLTAERFVPDPFSSEPGARLYKTGDLARFLADGNIEFLGRVDRQVKLRGSRIEPAEVEAALSQHPAVQNTAVLVQEGANGSSQLVAYVQTATAEASESDALNPDRLRQFLGTILPDYMIPGQFVVLDALPRTPHGKLDLAALPTPHSGERMGTPPRNRIETLLVQVVSTVLSSPQIGVHDNLFELGMDSILSLQIVARARQAGLHLTPKLLFQHQHIAALATVVDSVRPSIAEQEPVTGSVPLTPIQRWFFEQERPDLHHYNQSVFIQVEATIQPGLLRQALNHLLHHHDALRLRFEPAAGGWRQYHAPPTEEVPLLVEDLTAQPPTAQRWMIESQAARLQASLDIQAGPMVRAALFQMGQTQPSRLLLVGHHLVVDGVSWRILLEDLVTTYQQLVRSETVLLPAKTTSFKAWANHLVNRAPVETAELDDWLNASAGEALPLDYRAAKDRNTLASAASVAVSLTTEQTRVLLQETGNFYQAGVDELLLTALLQALADRTGMRRLHIDIESHGRETSDPTIDLTRTVGWFTTIFPVTFTSDPAGDYEAAVRAVTTRLRAVPNNGIDYGRLRYLATGTECHAKLSVLPLADILFNYLGQIDQVLWQPPLLGAAAENPGPVHGINGQRSHVLEINSLVSAGQLTCTWHYSRHCHRSSTIQDWADAFISALTALIEHAAAAPAIHPLAALDADVVQRLTTEGQDLVDAYPLSPLQEGILFHSRFQPTAQAYFQQLVCTIAGHLDVTTFRSAWEQVVARHPILRSAVQQLSQPLQYVYRHVTLPWQQYDWRAIPSDEQEQRLAQLLTADRNQGFELEQPPLLRCALIRIADQRHQFVLSHHHMILDGWSVTILFREVLNGYANLTQGRHLYLEPPPPYRDYITWLRQQPQEPSESYWRRQLAGFRAATALPGTSAAGQSPTPTHIEQAVALSPTLTATLQMLSRTHRVTLNTLIQGAWALLLHRYLGERDLVFGATVSTRPPELDGVANMVGLLINTVPVRVAIPDHTGLIPWLHALQDQQLEQQPYVYSALSDIQGWSDLPPGQALFESIVVFENYPLDHSLWQEHAGLVLADVQSVDHTHYALTLIVSVKSELTLRLIYNENRFQAGTISAMLSQLHTLLVGMAANPEGTLDDLSRLDPAERHRLVEVWNSTQADYPQDRCIQHLFEAQVQRTPEQIALVHGAAQISYRELNVRANQLAHHLRQLGVDTETRVGLCLRRSPLLAYGLLGILKAGGAYVPLDPSYPRSRLAYMLADAEVSILLTETALRDLVPADTVICLDSDWPAVAHQPVDNPTPHVAPDNLAYVIYTSGSTGRPKGVAMPHRPLVNLISWQIGRAGAVRTLQFAPLSFDVSFQECFATWCAGGVLVFVSDASRQDFGLLLEQLSHSKVQRLYLPFVALQHLAERAAIAPATLTHMDDIITAGEQLVATDAVRALCERWGCRLENQFGPTESHVVSAFQLPTDPASWDRLPPIGSPIANTRLYVLDANLQPVPREVAGELYIGGLAPARGYLDRPGLTAERFWPDPFSAVPGARMYRTSDLARWRQDGNLQFLGRADQQVKVRGFRVEPGEIEGALASHPWVRQCVVVAHDTGQGDVRLVAYITTAEDTELNVEVLRNFLSHELPAYMIPSAFMRLDALPLTPSGKVDRQALPALVTPGAADYVAPTNPVEEKLAEIWAALLDREQVSIHDDFFALGGHSLTAMRLATRVEEAFGIEFELRLLFEASTLSELAQVIFSCQLEQLSDENLSDMLRAIEDEQ